MTDEPGARIDCHAHYMAPRFRDHLRKSLAAKDAFQAVIASRPAWVDLDVHRDLMARARVHTAVLLPYGSELLLGLQGLGGSINDTCEAYNRSMSEDLAPTNGQFVSTAIVDPFGGKEAAAQLDRSLGLPAIVGVGLVASYGGITLEDPVFEPIFEVARAHDAPVMIHPSSDTKPWVEPLQLVENRFMRGGFAYLLDNTVCILRMATSGTFDKFHDVRFMFCQLGGLAAMCCARWEFQRHQALLMQEVQARRGAEWATKTLRDYLSHIWLDTHTQDRHALSLVLSEAGEQTIVLGGDHPYTLLEEGIPYAMAEVEALGLSPAATRRIERDNALALLGKGVTLREGPGTPTAPSAPPGGGRG